MPTCRWAATRRVSSTRSRLAMLLVMITLVVVVPADLVLGVGSRCAAPRRPTSAGRRAACHGVSWRADRRLPVSLTARLPLLALLERGRDPGGRRAVDPGQLDCGQLRRRAHPADRRKRSAGAWLLALAAAVDPAACSGGCRPRSAGTRQGAAVAVLVALTLVLPGSTLAVGMLISYGRWLADTLP